MGEEDDEAASNHRSEGLAGPAALARKKSILPQIELEEYNWRKAELSPYGSFRRKFVFTVPGVMKQEQPREYKLKALVVFLFFLIVIYISLTYVFHKQRQLHLLQIEIEERIHFHEQSRILRFFNVAKQELFVARIGIDLPTGNPHNCVHHSSSENRCLEWKRTARLQLYHVFDSHNVTRCFNIIWQSLNPFFIPHDCFSLSGHWYGMGELKDQHWLLKPINFSSLPFVTGSDPFGNILSRYWISSKGVSLFVHHAVPLYVSMNKNASEELCFKAKYENPYSRPRDYLPFLNYTVCTSSDIQTLHSTTIGHSRKLLHVTPNMYSMMEKIVWTSSKQNQNDIWSYVHEIANITEPVSDPGIIVLNEGWQKEQGDLSMNESMFDDVKTNLSHIRKKGFQIALKVSPYVSTSSANYLFGIENGIWILDAKALVPSLTKWKLTKSAAIIDFTNNHSVEWFNAKLQQLHDDGEIDGFYFVGGETGQLPFQYATSSPVKNPDELSYLYAQVACNSHLAFTIATAPGSTFRSFEAFVTLTPRTATWDENTGLKSVLRAVLTLGITGYPLVNPGSIGGDVLDGDVLPNKELYLRWLQLCAFLPVLQFSVHPKSLGDDIFNYALKVIEMRKAIVIPLLLSLINETAAYGFPIVRPLWWVAPNDSTAAIIENQFLLGNDLMVAPVLDPNQHRRKIYFPHGIWQNAHSKELHKGGRWIEDLVTPSENYTISYFLRVNFTNH